MLYKSFIFLLLERYEVDALFQASIEVSKIKMNLWPKFEQIYHTLKRAARRRKSVNIVRM